jgi:hypothetical protein
MDDPAMASGRGKPAREGMPGWAVDFVESALGLIRAWEHQRD